MEFARTLESSLPAPSERILTATGPTGKRSRARDDPFEWFSDYVAEIVPSSSDTFDKWNIIAKEISSYKKQAQKYGSGIMDSLQWLSKNKKKLPKLSKIALTVSVSQGFSAESQRHFSAFNARHIIKPQRNRLSPSVVEAITVTLECYKCLLL